MDEVTINIVEKIDYVSVSVKQPMDGAKGDKGDPGGSVSRAAGQILSGQRIVKSGADGRFYYADNSETDHMSDIVGLTDSAVIENEIVSITTFGIKTDPSFTFTPALPIFLGSNGLITQEEPTEGFSLVIGFPLSSDTLMISIKAPIRII